MSMPALSGPEAENGGERKQKNTHSHVKKVESAAHTLPIHATLRAAVVQRCSGGVGRHSNMAWVDAGRI
jgi:hypothetical protein